MLDAYWILGNDCYLTPKYLEINLAKFHFTCHTPHMDWLLWDKPPSWWRKSAWLGPIFYFKLRIEINFREGNFEFLPLWFPIFSCQYWPFDGGEQFSIYTSPCLQMFMIHANMQKRGCGNTGLWRMCRNMVLVSKLYLAECFIPHLAEFVWSVKELLRKFWTCEWKYVTQTHIRNNITVIVYKTYN